MRKSAQLFDIQNLATHDGPGIRTVIFFQGCPLRCTWCSNPEGQEKKIRLRWRSSRCNGCYSCFYNCGRGAVVKGKKREEESPKQVRDEEEIKSVPLFDRRICDVCDDRRCIAWCPSDALETTGYTITEEELFSEVKKDFRLFRNSGGGITLSGGEPFLYADFLYEFCKRLKSFSIPVAVETCGFWEWNYVEPVIPFIDLFFFDVKVINNEIHKRFTGSGNEKILSNLKSLAEIYVERIVVSVPVIPGVNDRLKAMKEIVEYIKPLGIKKVKILPYHNYSLSKYESLGMEYPHKEWDYPLGDLLKGEIEKYFINNCFQLSLLQNYR